MFCRVLVDADLVSLIAGSVGRGLHTLIESEQADLLVIGSCRRGFAGRVTLGNDTRAALNGATCAVAVAPQGYAQRAGEVRTVGVCYDGSPNSEAALAAGRELAGRFGASLRALHVVPVPVTSARYVPVAWPALLDTTLADAERHLAALDGVRGEAVFGIPGEELARFGASVDILIAGPRGYGPIRRLMLGSTSDYLTRHAPCPLLVLSADATVVVEEPDRQTAGAVASRATI